MTKHRIQMFSKYLVIILFIALEAPVITMGDSSRCSLIVIAKVTKIGEHPIGISGRSAEYWLAEYSIVDVLKGSFKKKEIMVAHLVLHGDELDDLQVGDEVLLCLEKVKKSKKFQHSVRDNADYEGELLLVGRK